MKWKKILFACLSLVFVFGFFINKDIVFATESVYTKAKYNSTTNTIDGHAVTGKKEINDTIYYNTDDSIYFQSKSNSKTDEVIKNDNPYTTWSSLEESERSWVDITKENMSPTQIAITAGRAVAEQFTSGFMKDIINGFLYLLAWLAQNVLLKLVALLVGIVGLLFEKIIDLTVVNMATNLQINNSGSFINIGWRILRDVINIMFIFVLLYIGIKTIVKGFESDTSKMITTVIVVALIINFSLFFTKIVIDASNIITMNFYESIKAQSENKDAGIAAIFIKNLGLTTQYNPSAQVPQNKDPSIYTGLIIGAVGGSVILCVLGVIILLMCTMLISRYIILIYVLIASSAAIGSWILPKLKSSIYDKWFNALIGQSFFAPVFMLFIYLAALFTTTINVSIDNLSWVDLFTSGNPTSQMNLVVNYMLVIGSLTGTLIISKSLSNMAGEGASKITGIIGGGALSLAGMAGRNTLGRASRRFADLDVINNFAARSAIGRGLRNTLKAGAKSSFDLRASSGVGKIVGATGIDLGKAGGKGGYAGTLEKQIKAREEFYKDIGKTTQSEKLKKDALQSKIDNLDESQKRQKLIKEIKEEEEELKFLKEGTQEHTDAKTALDAKKEEVGKLKTEINKKSEKWRESIKEIDDVGKARSSAYVESFDKLIGNVPKAWVGQKNKLAAVNLRNAKRKEQTDSEKTIGALKDLQKAIKESKKE